MQIYIIKTVILFFLLFSISGCQKQDCTSVQNQNEQYNCLFFSIPDLIAGKHGTQKCPEKLEPGHGVVYIPKNWLLDTTRSLRLVVDNSGDSEKKIASVTLNVDTSDFIKTSKPQDAKELLPASWSWCLKPQRSGCLYACMELDIQRGECSDNVVSLPVPIDVIPLPFPECIRFFWQKNYIWVVPFITTLIALIALFKDWFPRFQIGSKDRQRLVNIESKVNSLEGKMKK